MARTVVPLTDPKCDAAKPREKDYKLFDGKGLYLLVKDLMLPVVFHIDTANWGWITQTVFIAVVTVIQAFINHRGITLTTMLTDFSGYLIFAVTVVLIIGLIAFAPVALDFGRLFTFTGFTGPAGGDVWAPASDRSLVAIFPAAGAALVLGLLQGVYTITGFDASGHTSEETRNAATEVPKGMIHSVFWSAVFGYIMV